MSKKKEFVIEYDFQSSPQLLFQYLSTPSGLSEWFSDDVNYRGEKYTFFEYVFNLADSYISTGVIFLLVFNKKVSI